VAEHSEVLDHVGLLVNKPPGTARVALHLVVRRLCSRIIMRLEARKASELLFSAQYPSARDSLDMMIVRRRPTVNSTWALG